MTRGGTDMATYTTPRTPGTRRQPPGPAGSFRGLAPVDVED